MPKKCNNQELLIRIDERVETIIKQIEEHDKHFEKIYGHLENNTKTLERLKIKLGIIIAVVTGVVTLVWERISRMF